MTLNYSSNSLKNVHRNLDPPNNGETFLVKGDYEYWHYNCDGFDDRVINIPCNCNYSIVYRNMKVNSLYIYPGLGMRI
jgi:hypothetical protein